MSVHEHLATFAGKPVVDFEPEYDDEGEVAEVHFAADGPGEPSVAAESAWRVYGGDATVADLAQILGGGRLPSLGHLGLEDSEIQDEIAAAVAGAPIVARLESLSLAMGVLTDRGAESLLSGQPLTHLKSLDLHHHYLTEPTSDRVRVALQGVELDLSEEQDPEDDWPYVAIAE